MSDPLQRLDLEAADVDSDARLAALIADLRARCDSFIFLAGGAGSMPEEIGARLERLFAAFSLLARDGVRLAVGDGGTDAGIMRAAGCARHAGGERFPLLGIAPSEAVSMEEASDLVRLDPHHSHIVTLRGLPPLPGAPADAAPEAFWGRECPAMLSIFARLAADRPSIAIVANGGALVLPEVKGHLDAGRRVILLSGSGRAADALIALGRGKKPADAAAVALVQQATALGIDGPLLTQCDVLRLSTSARKFAAHLAPLLQA